MGIGYKLSPNEEQQLLKQEIERRRKLRITQVRQQSKINAANSRNAVKAERKRQIEILTEKVKFDLEEKRLRDLEQADYDFNENVPEFGLAHRNAYNEESDPKHAMHIYNKEHSRVVAVQRYQQAMQLLKEENIKKYHNNNRIHKMREQALDIEKVRSNHIASLPTPLPDSIASLDLSNFKTMKPVKCTDIKAFTNTHYHIASDSGFVEKADSYEESADAKQEAVTQTVELENCEKQFRDSVHERNAKAELRYKAALRKENVKNDYNQLLHDLSDLQRQDQNRRQKIVAKIPKQIFEAPFRRVEENKRLQNEIETAFEKMFIKRDDYDENAIPALCQPSELSPRPVDPICLEVIVDTEVRDEDSLFTSALDVTTEASLDAGRGSISSDSGPEFIPRDQRVTDEFKRLVQDVNQKRLQRLDKTDEIDLDATLTEESIIYSVLNSDQSQHSAGNLSDVSLESIINTNSDVINNTVITSDIESEFQREYGLSAQILSERQKQQQNSVQGELLRVDTDQQHDDWEKQKKILKEKLHDINIRRKKLNENLKNSLGLETLSLDSILKPTDANNLSHDETSDAVEERRLLLEHGEQVLSRAIRPIERLPSPSPPPTNALTELRAYDDALLRRPSPLREFQDITSSEYSSSARLSLTSSGYTTTTSSGSDPCLSSYADLPNAPIPTDYPPPHPTDVDLYNEADYANLSAFIDRLKSADSSYLPDELLQHHQPDSISLISSKSLSSSLSSLQLSSRDASLGSLASIRPSESNLSTATSLSSATLISLSSSSSCSAAISASSSLFPASSSTDEFDMSRALESVGITSQRDNWLMDLCRDADLTLSDALRDTPVDTPVDTSLSLPSSEYSRQFSVDSLDVSQASELDQEMLVYPSGGSGGGASGMAVVLDDAKADIGYPVVAADSGMFSGITSLAGTDVNQIQQRVNFGKYSDFNDYRLIPSVSETMIKEQVYDFHEMSSLSEADDNVKDAARTLIRRSVEANNTSSSLRGYQSRLNYALEEDILSMEVLSPSLCLVTTSSDSNILSAQKPMSSASSMTSNAEHDLAKTSCDSSISRIFYELSGGASSTTADPITTSTPQKPKRPPPPEFAYRAPSSTNEISPLFHAHAGRTTTPTSFKASTSYGSVMLSDSDQSIERIIRDLIDSETSSLSNQMFNLDKFTFNADDDDDADATLSLKPNGFDSGDYTHGTQYSPATQYSIPSDLNSSREQQDNDRPRISTDDFKWPSFSESFNSSDYGPLIDEPDLTLMSLTSTPRSTSNDDEQSVSLHRQSYEEDTETMNIDLSESLLSFQQHEKSTSEIEQCNQFELKRKKLMNSSERRKLTISKNSDKHSTLSHRAEQRHKIVQLQNERLKASTTPYKASCPVIVESTKPKKSSTKEGPKSSAKRKIVPRDKKTSTPSQQVNRSSAPTKLKSTANSGNVSRRATSSRTKSAYNVVLKQPKESVKTTTKRAGVGVNKKPLAPPTVPTSHARVSQRRSTPHSKPNDNSAARSADEFNNVFNSWKHKRSL